MISFTHDQIIAYLHFIGGESEILRGFAKHLFGVTSRPVTERTFQSRRSPVALSCIYKQHAFCIQCRHPQNSLGFLPSTCLLPCADLGLLLISCTIIFGLYAGLLIVGSWIEFLHIVPRLVSIPAPLDSSLSTEKICSQLVGFQEPNQELSWASCLSRDLKIWLGFYEPALLYSQLERIYGYSPSQHPFPQSC